MASTGSSVAQAMAIILARFPPFGFSQAQADIVVPFRGSGQALGTIVKFAKQTGFGQAQADVKRSFQGAAQAQAFVTI